jgi:redox-sensitive bicupin YhaK (pirin superfamily)
MMHSNTKARSVAMIVPAHHQLEGAGFGVFRPFPTAGFDMLDPFLMLDEKEPEIHQPGSAKGAPDHPHRGFETVSYVLDGETEHCDSLGNRDVIGTGDVQWMTAGDGIVHSEMPSTRIQTEGGRVHGFQLWVNLPAALKRTQPRYQALSADELPRAEGEGWAAIVIAGDVFGVQGPARTHTPVVYAHVTIEPAAGLSIALPADHQAGIYVFGGTALAGAASTPVGHRDLAVFEPGDGAITVAAPSDAERPTEALLMAGRPLNEPVARYGPFVMNTRAEIVEAIEDYQAGRMGQIDPAGT